MVMKYWNKDKKIRERCWHRVRINRARMANCSWQDIKRMLQLYPSTGKFFMVFEYSHAEFELKQDAVWFTLKWE